MSKIKWRVGGKPTGRYRSFFKRSWPSAEYHEHPVATISCESQPSYYPQVAETEELIVRVADWRESPWQWRKLKARPVGVKAAKELVQRFYDANPDWLPPQSIS